MRACARARLIEGALVVSVPSTRRTVGEEDAALGKPTVDLQRAQPVSFPPKYLHSLPGESFTVV